MRRAVVLALVLAAAAPPRRAAAQRASASLSEDEKAFCASELEVIEKRRRIFEAQGLAPADIARRNEPAEQDLAACRRRFKDEGRRAAERRADEAELQRRAGPDATQLERQKIWREIRRDRLLVRPASTLTAEEKAELAEGLGDEEAETHATLDLVHSRDPVFMRQVHSALACYHRDRKEELQALIDEETAHVRLGSGDRNKVYLLKSDLKQSDEVLARCAEAARGYAGGLIRCTDTRTAILARCLAIRFEGKPHEPACDSEEIQQYIRFIK
jgi:hypothetical protein